MSAAETPAAPPSRGRMTTRLLLALFPLFLLLCVHVTAQLRDGWFLLDGRLLGPDSHMRLVKVTELYQHRDWYDHTTKRSNAPYGEELHWTRPLDLILLAGAMIGAPFAGFDSALFWWGALVNPSLHVLALLALLWAAEPLFPPGGRIYLGVLFTTQFFIVFQFATGRPDHHGLIALTLTMLAGFAIRLLDERTPARLAAWAALPAALGIWVSIEGLLGIILILAPLAAAWIRWGRHFADKGWRFAATLLALATLAFVIEQPPALWLEARYDALSPVHLFLFLLAALLTLGAVRLPLPERPSARLAFAAAAAAAGLAALWLLFPKFFSGPMVDVDPEVIARWFKYNREVSPLVRTDDLMASAANVVGHLGPLALSLPFALYLARHSTLVERRNWLFLLFAMALTVPMAFYEVRWTGHAQLFTLFGYAAVLLSLLDRYRDVRRPYAALARAGTVIGFAIGPLILAAFILAAKKSETEPPNSPKCRLKPAAEYLQIAYGERPRTVMAFNYYGPEIMYRSHHRVVVTPYHRNTAGMLDAFAFFGAVNMAAAKAIADQRNVELVMFCPSDNEATYYIFKKGAPTLLKRMIDGTAPPWVKEVAMPDKLKDRFRLFEIAR